MRREPRTTSYRREKGQDGAGSTARRQLEDSMSWLQDTGSSGFSTAGEATRKEFKAIHRRPRGLQLEFWLLHLLAG